MVMRWGMTGVVSVILHPTPSSAVSESVWGSCADAEVAGPVWLDPFADHCQDPFWFICPILSASPIKCFDTL